MADAGGAPTGEEQPRKLEGSGWSKGFYSAMPQAAPGDSSSSGSATGTSSATVDSKTADRPGHAGSGDDPRLKELQAAAGTGEARKAALTESLTKLQAANYELTKNVLETEVRAKREAQREKLEARLAARIKQRGAAGHK